jgi:hypothetical protein
VQKEKKGEVEFCKGAVHATRHPHLEPDTTTTQTHTHSPRPSGVQKEKKGEAEFFEGAGVKKELAGAYVANQKALDAAIMPALSADLKAYLGARFSLKDGDRPHMLKF